MQLQIDDDKEEEEEEGESRLRTVNPSEDSPSNIVVDFVKAKSRKLRPLKLVSKVYGYKARYSKRC